MLIAVKFKSEDGEMIISFIKEETSNENGYIVADFEELEDFVCCGNEVPIGNVLIHNGVVIVHETGEIEFIEFGNNKTLKISA